MKNVLAFVAVMSMILSVLTKDDPEVSSGLLLLIGTVTLIGALAL